ncbi:hypothetical protein E2C01_002565 [Portunus trituberculatus]|uniref:Uncharacterized protein n=1 Tax=Portunus trituberculatus TaxID=210409 RepID=A0A5B7CMJ4_PORTR|nr:hypothetical protein [Portunus trituberculatus]
MERWMGGRTITAPSTTTTSATIHHTASPRRILIQTAKPITPRPEHRSPKETRINLALSFFGSTSCRPRRRDDCSHPSFTPLFMGALLSRNL